MREGIFERLPWLQLSFGVRSRDSTVVVGGGVLSRSSSEKLVVAGFICTKASEGLAPGFVFLFRDTIGFRVD